MSFFLPDNTTHSEALGTLPVSESSGDSGAILGAVADSRETRSGACAGVVGEVNELYDGIVDTAISVQGRVSLTDNDMKNRENIENKNAEGTHFTRVHTILILRVVSSLTFPQATMWWCSSQDQGSD